MIKGINVTEVSSMLPLIKTYSSLPVPRGVGDKRL